MGKAVFVSHAQKNRGIADKLVDLMETGIGITDSEIFCSSLEGLGIPSGLNFVDFIKRQIESPKVVILLLSKDYFKSQFCLAELGASWVLSHRIVPLLIPPLEYKDIKAVLTGIQLLKISDMSDLNQMQEDLVEAIGIKGKPFARWEAKRNSFIESISEELQTDDEDDHVSLDDHLKVKNDYNEAVTEIEEMQVDLDKKNEIIDALKNAKDKMEVEQIVSERLDEVEVFGDLLDAANKSLAALPEIVREAVFSHYRGETLAYPDFGEDYKRQQIREAEEKDYLLNSDDGLSIIEEDPAIHNAMITLNRLKRFVESAECDASDFVAYYENNYDHRLNFESRRFWDEHLW